MAASVSRRLFGVSTAVAAITLLAGAVAAYGAWLPYAGRAGVDDRLAIVVSAVLRLGASAVFVGGAILVFLYFSRHWPIAQPTVSEAHRPGLSPGLIPFGIYLAALPFLFVTAAGPAIQFVRTNRPLLDDPIGGLGLMVPLFESLATVALLIGSVAVVGLFLSRSATFPKCFIVLVGFQLGFVLMAFQAIDIGSALTERLASALPAFQQHDAAVRTVARNQTWLLVASAIWMTFLVMSPRMAAAFDAQPQSTETVPRSTEQAVQVPSFPVLLQPRYSTMQSSTLAGNAPRYSVRANYFAGFLGGALEAVDLNSPAVLSATLGLMTGHIQVYSSGLVTRKVVKATRNRYFTPWPEYIVASPANQPIGGVKKVSRTEWRILDAGGQEIGSIEQGPVSIGRAKYQAHIGNTTVCTFSWSNVLMPQLVLDCAPDVDRWLDGRLALACALALFVDVCPTA
jgi:hypothetical protein